VTEEIITVTVNDLPSFTVTTPPKYCQFGASDQLFIETEFTNFTGTATGASQGSYAPRWYSAPDTSSFMGNSPKPSTDSVGTHRYYVQVENTTTGCLSTYDFVDVEVLQSPAQPTLTSPLVACENASRIPAVSNLNDVNSDYNILKTITLASNANALSAAQGSGNYRSVWYEADTATEIDLSVSQNKIIPNLSIPDTLLYFVSQFSIIGSNGCPSKKLAVPVYVAAKPSFTVLSENGQFSVCRNDSLELSIQTPVNSTTYEWIKGASTPSIPTTPLTYSTNAQLGTNYLAHSNNPNSNYEVYWVRAVDSNQCFMQKSVTVNQIALPANNTGYVPTSLNYCFGADAQELQVSTEVGSLTALWYDNTTNAFLGDSIVPNTLVAPSTSTGTSFTTTPYKFKLKNQMTGCVSEIFRTVDVKIYQLPDAPIITRDWTECFNTDMANVAPLSSTLLTTTGLTTKWYDADTNLLSGGSYRPSSLRTDTAVYYVSSIGGGTMYCESNFSEVLAYTLALPQPILSYSDPDGLICYGEEFEVFVLPDTTNANWDFTWRNISTGVPFTEQQDGSYFARNILKYESFELLIEDDRTCQNFMYFDVDVYPEIIPPGSFINHYCYNQDSIRLSANYPQNTIPAGYKLTWLDSNHNRLAIAPFAPTWIQPSNSNFIDIPYLIEFKDTIKGCYSEEVGVAARINALPPDPILLRDWATCYGEPNPIAINGNPLRPQIAVVGSNNFKWIGPDSASILNSAPIPSTLRNDTVHYFVRTVSNINNCESANMVAIKAYTFPLPQPIVAVSDSDRIVCRGEALEFEVTDTSTNGWTYQWTKFDARVSPPIPAVPAAPGLGLLYQDSVTYNTQYELRTTDTNSCFSKNIWNITKADYPIVDSIIVKEITCYNMDDGEITIFSRFGQSLRYSLDSGATYTFRAKDTALEKGWYYVDVVDNFSNCPTIYQANDRHVYVHEPLPLKIDTVITQDITCFGLLDGQMQIVASGGYILDSTLFNYLKPEKLYSIDAGATFYLNDSLPGSTSSGMINLAAGLYQIRVENVNGCQAINNQNYTITLNQPDLAYIDTIIVTPISCYNQTDGTIDVRAFGGNSLTYSIDSVQYFPTGLFNNLGSQAYFLEVVDSLGCLITPNSQSDSIWISEPAPLTVNPIVNQLLCYHDSTGLIELDIIGGNPNFQSYQYGYDIDWDVDTASLTMPINSSYYLPNNDSIYGLIAGTYYANIVDFKGCGIVVPIVVNEPDPVEVNSITIVPVSCYGIGDGRILVNATGGNYLEYELTTSLGVPPPSWQANPLFTLLDSDTTFVTVRDSNACLVTYNTITKNFVPQPDSAFVDTIITHDILCFSDSTGSIFIKAFGGNSLTYSIDSVFTGTTFYPGLVADTFYVQVVDSKSCPVNYMNNDSIIILTEPPLLVLESNLVRGVTCYYDTTGQIGHLITGGVLPHTLVLNDLDTLTSTTLTTNLYGGPWYFTSYDANGCRDSSLVYIPTTDYDCDSIPDNIEGDTDFNFDGIPNMMDFDSDGDGIPDIVERDYNRDGIIYDDCDNDGWPDYLDTDQCNFFIPNILTPNGDGDNDFFVIPELDKYPNNQLSIYDRLGNLVFQQTSYVNTFDGSANRNSALSTTNSQLPIDTYFYIVEVNGVPFQSGYIFIMR
jgi:gliding motility-associated-like protein